MFDELFDEVDEFFNAFDELKANRAFMGSSNKRTRLVAMKEGDHTYAHCKLCTFVPYMRFSLPPNLCSGAVFPYGLETSQ